MTSRLVRSFRSLLLTLVAALAALSSETAHGAVSPDGSLVHGVEIRIPPGTNGMAPKLALAYSSQAANGSLGMGWRLVGLPTISRVGYGYGVNYDGLDTYSAEGGGRLVRQSDNSYFPEVWSGGKYIPYGTCGDGPCMWVQKSGTGIDMYFGGVNPSNPTADHSSRIYRNGTSGSVRVWALARVVNTRDQIAYEVAYARDTAEGDYYPQTLAYTLGVGLSVWNTITFQTEPRTDAIGAFTQGAWERWDRRINLIRVATNGRTVREYALSYEYGARSGRSRIRSIQEKGSAGGSLPAQTFTWQEGTDALSMERWMTGQPGTIAGGESAANSAWFEGDYNGDGRTDRCKVYQSSAAPAGMWADCYLASGTSFVYAAWARGYVWHTTDPSGGRAQWFSGDFDGDGRTDLAQIYDDAVGALKVTVHRSTGTGFTQETWNPTQGVLFSTNAAAGGSQWFSADFNGDGRTDLGVVYNNGGTMNADVYLSSGKGPTLGGAGFVYRQWAVSQGGWISTNTAAGNSQWFATDFNGDGKADLAKIWNEAGLLYADVHVSSGSAFSMQRWATQQGGWISTNVAAGGSQWFVGDFNGDGKTDLAKIWGGSDLMSSDVHLSTGRSFAHERWATNLAGWVPTNAAGDYSQWTSGDFNGDGKTDLSRMWKCSAGGVCIDVYASRFGAFLPQRWATGQGAPIGNAQRQWFQGDFDGDGKTDMAKMFVSGGLGGEVHRSGGLQSDLISQLTNGIGGLTTVTYAQSLPASAIGAGCGLEASGGGYQHGTTSGNNDRCGISNAAPRALVSKVRFDNGALTVTQFSGGPRSQIYTYSNGRVKPSGFDEDDYRARNPDVAGSVYGSLPFGMEQHYNEYGRAEGRYMRLRAADLGFERHEEKDEQTGALAQMYFRQDFPFQARPSLTVRTMEPLKLEEKYAYSSWVPLSGSLGINDYKKITTTYENNVKAHGITQTKALDVYGYTTRVVDDAGEGYTVTTDTVVTHDAQSWVIGRIDQMKKYRTDNQNVLEWEKLRYNSLRQVDLKQKYLCSNAAGCTSTNGQWVNVAWGHVYDSFGNLTSVRDARGVITATSYDTTYRAYITKVVSDSAGLAHTKTMTYGALTGTNVNTETDLSGQQLKTTTDQFGRKILVETPLGGRESYSYNAYGTVGQQYDETLTTVDTRVVRKRTYFDGASRVFKAETTGDDGKTIVVKSEDYVTGGRRRTEETLPHHAGETVVWTKVDYDGANRQTQAVLPDSSLAQYAYGPGSASVTERVGNKLRTTTEYFTPRGRMWKKKDALGGEEVISYDEMQRPIKVTYQGNTQVTTAYDSFGLRRSVTDYSSGTARTTAYTYDANGNVFESRDPRGNWVRYTYDNLNRMTIRQRQLAGGTSLSTDATFTYDDPAVAFSKGHLTAVTDSSGSVRFAYDARGRVTTRTTNIAGLTNALTMGLGYDAGGRTTRMTFPNGGVQQTAYTDAGNVKQILFNDAEYASFSGYSAVGAPATKRTPQTTTAYTYTGKGLMATQLTTGPGGRQFQNNVYSYDEAGNVTAILDQRASKVVNNVNTDESQTFVYDQINRLVRATGRYGGVAGTVKSFAYDGGTAGADTQPAGLGNLTTLGGSVNRTFGHTGQMPTSGTGFTASYDASGNMTSKTQDGVTWTYVFDYNNRLTQVKKAGVTRLDVVYNYQGERVKKIFYPGNGRTITTYYAPGGYEVRVDSAAPGLFRRTVHLGAWAGRIASITTSSSTATAAVLTDRQHRELADGSDASSPTGLARKVFHLASAMLPASGQVRNGVLAAMGFATALLLAWMLKRRLESAHLRAPRWTSERRLSFSSRLVIAPLLLLLGINFSGCGEDLTRDGEIEQVESAVLSGDPSMDLPAGTAFYHSNQIGSTSVISDSAGVLHTQVGYLPFGEIDQARSAGNNVVTQKFAGQTLDDETGLSFMGARYYDPGIGRFISADSIVPGNGDNAQGFNRYAYADNNPVNNTDPTGHFSFPSNPWKTIARIAWKITVALVAVAIVVGIVAVLAFTGGAAAVALGFAAGSFWGAVVGGAISGFLISGAMALRSGASPGEALVAAFQGAIVGAIGGGVGNYVQGIGGVTKGLGEALATSGARGLASGAASSYMNGARGSEVLKSGLYGAASGMACATAVYGLDKLAKAYAGDGFGKGQKNTFGFAVSKENGGAHDSSLASQRAYMAADPNRTYGDSAFTEGGVLSRAGVAAGLNPTSQVHDGVQGMITQFGSSDAASKWNVFTMVPANVVASYGMVAQEYPEFYTTGPMTRVTDVWGWFPEF